MEEAEMGSFFSQLPVEITTDILSRLPVVSVIQCKLVCKTWRSLVEDPVFLDIHTHRLLLKPGAAAGAAVTTNTEFYLSVQLQFPEKRQKYYFGEYNNHDEMSNSSSSCFKFSKPLNAQDDDGPFSEQYHWYPIGSSNGLICSFGKNRGSIYVYNPCTRECVCLPPLISISKQFHLLNGFGYNPLTNEYKVVLIRSIRPQGISQPGEDEVCLYTLGSGKWRTNKLESWSPNGFFIQPGVFFNGALHWIVWELINIDHYHIFSFDLANEEFRMIVPSPPLSTRFNHLFCVEHELWGGCCLCVGKWDFVTETTDIWVLMNSKDKDMKSSTMKFKIPAATADEENELRYYYPIALFGRDKILLYCNKMDGFVFVSYDSETGNFEDEVIDYSELQPSKFLRYVTPYTKSFVSLKPFGEEDAG